MRHTFIIHIKNNDRWEKLNLLSVWMKTSVCKAFSFVFAEEATIAENNVINFISRTFSIQSMPFFLWLLAFPIRHKKDKQNGWEKKKYFANKKIAKWNGKHNEHVWNFLTVLSMYVKSGWQVYWHRGTCNCSQAMRTWIHPRIPRARQISRAAYAQAWQWLVENKRMQTGTDISYGESASKWTHSHTHCVLCVT